MPEHPNIIRFIDYGEGSYKDCDVYYIVMECAGLGDMCSFIINTGNFEEEFARYYAD